MFFFPLVTKFIQHILYGAVSSENFGSLFFRKESINSNELGKQMTKKRQVHKWSAVHSRIKFIKLLLPKNIDNTYMEKQYNSFAKDNLVIIYPLSLVSFNIFFATITLPFHRIVLFICSYKSNQKNALQLSFCKHWNTYWYRNFVHTDKE